MSILARRSVYSPLVHQSDSTPLYTRFLNWSKGQEKNRFLWLGIALTGHGCFLTPLTIYAILLSGMPFTYFIVALAAMALALVTNLAALPTKITIPAFLLSLAIDLCIIIASVWTIAI